MDKFFNHRKERRKPINARGKQVASRRRADALALEWADIDWVVGTLTIRGTVFQGEKVLPKNGRFHQLMMTPPLRACFESVYLQRQVERSVDSGALSRWIFCSEQGTPIDGIISEPAGGRRSWPQQGCRRSGRVAASQRRPDALGGAKLYWPSLARHDLQHLRASLSRVEPRRRRFGEVSASVENQQIAGHDQRNTYLHSLGLCHISAKYWFLF